jgi:uncharacterized protein YbjT (DUF2867 family)
VAVFGASGNIGRHVVDQLLAAGHIVTAYVRNPAKLSTTHPNLIVIQGELDDPTGVAGAVDGADAVISALGPTLRRGATGIPISDGTRTIIAAMKAAGVRRFVGLATPQRRRLPRPTHPQGQGAASHGQGGVPERPHRARRDDRSRHQLRPRLDDRPHHQPE